MAGKRIFLYPQGSVLVPGDETNEQLVRSMKPGKVVQLKYVQPRYGEHHKRIWKEFSEVAVVLTAHGVTGYTDAESVKDFALELTGRAQLVPISKALAKKYGGEEAFRMVFDCPECGCSITAPGAGSWAIRRDSIGYAKKDQEQITRFHNEWKAAFFETCAPFLPREAVEAIEGVFNWINPNGRWGYVA